MVEPEGLVAENSDLKATDCLDCYLTLWGVWAGLSAGAHNKLSFLLCLEVLPLYDDLLVVSNNMSVLGGGGGDMRGGGDGILVKGTGGRRLSVKHFNCFPLPSGRGQLTCGWACCLGGGAPVHMCGSINCSVF